MDIVCRHFLTIDSFGCGFFKNAHWRWQASAVLVCPGAGCGPCCRFLQECSYTSRELIFSAVTASSLTGTGDCLPTHPIRCEADDSSWCQIIEVFSTMKTQPLHLQGNTKSFRWHRFAVKSLIFGHRRILALEGPRAFLSSEDTKHFWKTLSPTCVV